MKTVLASMNGAALDRDARADVPAFKRMTTDSAFEIEYARAICVLTDAD